MMETVSLKHLTWLVANEYFITYNSWEILIIQIFIINWHKNKILKNWKIQPTAFQYYSTHSENLWYTIRNVSQILICLPVWCSIKRISMLYASCLICLLVMSAISEQASLGSTVLQSCSCCLAPKQYPPAD